MMTRLTGTIFAIIIMMAVPLRLHSQDVLKKQVAVYTTDSKVEDDVKKVISSQIVAKITQSPNYRALERTDEFLSALRKAEDFDTSGEVKDSQIAIIGQKLGVQYVAVVDISEIMESIYVSARLIVAKTGAIITTAEGYVTEISLPKLIKLAEEIGTRLTSDSSSLNNSTYVNNLSNGGPVERFTVNGVTFEMVKVDGGSFMMGSYDGASDEQPVHSERVGDFYIGKTEVTQQLWTAVMGSNPSRFRGENLPVENVSWFDCQEFVERLSRLTGRIFRLPTEAEWEYAARGGNRSRGYKYSGSNDLYRVAWYTENSSSQTHPVGLKLDNELGLFDMSGNVWEWVSDSFSNSYSQSRNSSDRVNRGGGWSNSAGACRSAFRNYNTPGNRRDNLGFRLAL